MGRAVTESLEVMGLADRQVVMVAHRDTAQPHVHVVVNRVSVEDGRAAKLGNSYLKLSRWAEGYEREQGHIRCPQRVENNAERDRGEWVRCASTKPGRYRRGPGRKSQIRRRQVGVRVVMERKPGVFASPRGQLEFLNCISRISEGSPRCTSSGRLK